MDRFTTAATQIDYPEGDGKPMGETDGHIDALIYLREALRDHCRDDPQTYVAGNMLLYDLAKARWIGTGAIMSQPRLSRMTPILRPSFRPRDKPITGSTTLTFPLHELGEDSCGLQAEVP